MRFEAWEAWNVAATIAAIPALLELAMVLFLAGVVILLWTLDHVVAKVITAFVAVFLFAVSSFTVLPVISQRCPYRSPTAWACVAAARILWFPATLLSAFGSEFADSLSHDWKSSSLYETISSIIHIPIFLAQAWRHASIMVQWPHFNLGSWRTRDMESCRPLTIRYGGIFRGQSWNTREAALRVLEDEVAHLRHVNIPEADAQAAIKPNYYGTADALVRSIGETALLLRSLDWVRRSSQDLRVEAYVNECLDTIFPISDGSSLCPPTLIMLVVLSCMHAAELNYIQWPQLVICAVGGDRLSKLAASRNSLCSQWTVRATGHSLPYLFWLNRSIPAVDMALVLAARRCSETIKQMLNGTQSGGTTAHIEVQVFNWFTILYENARPGSPAAKYLLSAMTRPILCDPKMVEEVETRCPTGLLYQLFKFACWTSSVMVGEDSNLGTLHSVTSIREYCRSLTINPAVIEEGQTRKQYSQLVTNYCAPRLTASQASQDHAAMFMLAFCASRPQDHFIGHAIHHSIDNPLGLMILAAQAMLNDRGVSGSCQFDFTQWLDMIHYLTRDLISRDSDSTQFVQLAHIFETLYIRNILVGDQTRIRSHLHRFLVAAHDNRNTCPGVHKQSKCHWIKHECTQYYPNPGCTLLPYHADKDDNHSFLSETSEQQPAVRSVLPHTWRIWRRRGQGQRDDVENQPTVEGSPGAGVAEDLDGSGNEQWDTITLPQWFVDPEGTDATSANHGDAQSGDLGAPLGSSTPDHAHPMALVNPGEVSATTVMDMRDGGEPEQLGDEVELPDDSTVSFLQSGHSASQDASFETQDNRGASQTIQDTAIESQPAGGGSQARAYGRCAYMLA